MLTKISNFTSDKEISYYMPQIPTIYLVRYQSVCALKTFPVIISSIAGMGGGKSSANQ